MLDATSAVARKSPNQGRVSKVLSTNWAQQASLPELLALEASGLEVCNQLLHCGSRNGSFRSDMESTIRRNVDEKHLGWKFGSTAGGRQGFQSRQISNFA